MKMRKILAIVLIINFIFFSISNIVFAINTENNVIDTELEEKDINDKNINKDVEKQEDTDSDEENDQELNAENNKQDSDDEFIQDKFKKKIK